MGAVLRFPVSPRLGQQRAAPSPKVAKVPRFWSEMQALDPEGAARLLDTTKDILLKSKALVEYVDHNRQEARSSGVETIAIELSAILEGSRLNAVQEALEDAVETGSRPMITLSGFAKLRRAELLVAEADQAVTLFAETPSTSRLQMGYPSHPSHAPCGLCGTSSGIGQALENIPISLIVLGVIGAGAIFAVVIMALTKKK
jgi:hypothetical protein